MLAGKKPPASARTGQPSGKLPAKLPAPAARAGSWLAQKGDTGLRLHGYASGASFSGRTAAAENRCQEGPRLRTGSQPSPRQPAQRPSSRATSEGDDISDSLDELLTHAQASLNLLERLKRRDATAQEEILRKGDPHSNLAPEAAKLKAKLDRRKAEKEDSFWKPRCEARLWSGADEEDGVFGSCGSDTESTASDESDSRVAWDCLREAAPPSARPPQAKGAAATTTSAPSRRATYGAAGIPVTTMPEQDGCRAQRPRPSGGAASPKPRSVPPPRRPSPVPPTGGMWDEEPPPEARPAGPGAGPRHHQAGFRFGGRPPSVDRKASRSAANGAGGRSDSTLAGPEREVTCWIATAQQAGPEALKAAFKQMLLKWHPDKAPQGDDRDAVAKREEATRVLRFVLQERERLGV